MNLAMAQRMALELMKEHGLIAKGWTFKFDRSVTRLGVTSFAFDRVSREYVPGHIALSRPLTERRGEMDVRNTILHEIAHALVGSDHGHNIVWKRKALEIGCDGKRCSTLKPEEAIKPKYAVICNHVSGKHIVRTQHRKSNIAERAVCAKHRSPLVLVKVP